MMSFKKSAAIALALLVVAANVNAAEVVPGGAVVGEGAPLLQLVNPAGAAVDEANPAVAAAAAAAAAAANPAALPAPSAAPAPAPAEANPVPANPAEDKRTRAQKAGDALVAGFWAAIAGVNNHKVTTGASVATLVSLTATGARLKVMFNAATPAVKAAGFKAFATAELKKVFARDSKADKYVTAGVIATVASLVTTVGSLALHETDVASKGLAHLPALPKWRSALVA